MSPQMTHASPTLKPTTTMILNAAEALLLQSRAHSLTLTDDDLCEQLVLDRGIRFDMGAISESAHALLDTDPRDIEAYRISTRWLRNFRTFLDTAPASIS